MPSLIADYLIKHGATINTGNQYNTFWYDDLRKRYTYYIHDIKDIDDKELHDIICKAYHLDNIPNYITLDVSENRVCDAIYYRVFSKTPMKTLEDVKDDRQFQICIWFNDKTPHGEDNLPTDECIKQKQDLESKLFNKWLNYIQ